MSRSSDKKDNQDVEAPKVAMERIKADEPGQGTILLDEEDLKEVKRGPTDCICCWIFIAAIVALIVIHVQCAEEAYLFKIMYPLDHAGNSCGLGDYKLYPKVYYPAKKMVHSGPLLADVHYSNPKHLWSVCTAECPQGFSREDRQMCNEKDAGSCTWYSTNAAHLYLGQYCIPGGSLVQGPPDQTGTVCASAQDAVNDVEDEAFQSLDNMGAAQKNYSRYIMKEIPELETDETGKQMMLDLENRIPEKVATLKEAIRNTGANNTEKNLVQTCKDALSNQKSALSDFLSDVLNSWKILATVIVICLYVGAMYLLIICFFVKTMIWGSVLACIVGFGVAGGLFWDESIQVADTGMAVPPASEEKILAVICWLACFICMVIVFCCRRSLQLAIAISTASSSFLLKNLGIMLLPQLLCLMQILFIVYWCVGLSSILSTAEVLPASDVTEEFDRFVLSPELQGKIWYHVLIGCWVTNFLEGVGTVATAITVTDWYYKPKVNGSKPTSHCSFVGGLFKALVYHTGSIAFGSAIIAVVTVFKFIVMSYMKLVRQSTWGQCGVRLTACCICCLSCVERTLKFIDFNAYLMVGISGKGYCASAQAAWGVVTRNPRRFMVLNGVMWTVNIIGRMFIVGIAMVWGALLLNKTMFPSLSKDVHSPWPALLCIVVISYMLAGIIFGVFTTAGAALFYNFVADEEVCAFSGKDCKDHAPGDLGKLLNAEAKRATKLLNARKQTLKPDEKIKADLGEDEV